MKEKLENQPEAWIPGHIGGTPDMWVSEDSSG